jgi:hypothetical protein
MRRLALLVAMLVLAAACKSTSPVAGKRAVPAPSNSAVVTAPKADLPLSSVNFSCRLPVVKSVGGGDSVTYSGGFVSFPKATYTADQAGVIHTASSQPVLVTDATPVLTGLVASGDHPFYDLAQRRWVPVGPGQSAPDGAHYSYATVGQTSSIPARVHIVDVTQGTERTFDFPVPEVGAVNGVRVADFSGAGVYLIADQFEQYPAGAWLLSLESGSSRPLTQVKGVIEIRDGYAWVGRVDPRDPAPPRRSASGQWFDSISRVNLETGVETPWFYRPGASVGLAGFDGKGTPVIEIAPSANDSLDQGEMRVIVSPGAKGIAISGGGLRLQALQADGDRLWFGSDRGIYLWTAADGLRKVFAFSDAPQPPGTASPEFFPTISPAGFCR